MKDLTKKMNLRKNIFPLIAMLVSVVMIIIGIVALSGGFGGSDSTSYPSRYDQEIGYAAFGADFYTYVNNNAARAGSNTGTLVHNTFAVGRILGWFVMLFGFLSFCFFGMKLDLSRPAPEAAPAEPVAAPAAEPEAVPAEPEAVPAEPAVEPEAAPEAESEAAPEAAPEN